MQQLQATILAKTSPKACRAHLKTCLDEATEYTPQANLLTIVATF